MGAEVNVLPAGLIHNLNICLTRVVIEAWNMYALQRVGEVVCSVHYKGIALTAKFNIGKVLLQILFHYVLKM